MKSGAIRVIFYALLCAIKISAQTFDLHEGKLSECDTEINADVVIIETPNYPKSVPKNLDCVYKITSNKTCTAAFRIEFLDFHLNPSPQCSGTRLEINTTAWICGLISGIRSYQVASGEIHLKFHTEEISDGFRIRINRLGCESEETIRERIDRKASLCGPSYPEYPINPGYPNACQPQPNYPIPTYPQRPPTTPDPYPNFPQNPNYPEYPKYPSNPNYPQIPTYPQNPAQYPNYPQYPEYPNNPQIPIDLPRCCSNVYNRGYFFLASPEFPHSSRVRSDCVFPIQKQHQNICQLRIFFKFFWIGQLYENNVCPLGFLEIDGKRFCGCQTGITLISKFSSNQVKYIRYRNEGVPRNGFSGVTLEIRQENCRRQNRQVHIGSFAISSANHLETFDENENSFNTSVHVYEYPIIDIDVTTESRNVEANLEAGDALAGEATANAFTITVNELICRKWSLIEWVSLNALAVFQETGTCRNPSIPPTPPPNGNNPEGCQIISSLSGRIQSPGYPVYYPSGANICYRFQRLPGYCNIRLSMTDFDVEASSDCLKDYLYLNNRRFCGHALQNVPVTLDLSNKRYEDVWFVTAPTPYHCGRGFLGTFQHLSCSVPPPPPEPENPTCGGVFAGPQFTLQSAQGFYKSIQCNYRIVKTNPSICRVALTFENLDFDCQTEYLLINNREYCGMQLSGRTTSERFEGRQLEIVYKRLDILSAGRTFLVHGYQAQDNCDDFQLNVPVARLSHDATGNYTGNVNPKAYERELQV